MTLAEALIQNFGAPVRLTRTGADFRAVNAAGYIMRGEEQTGLTIPMLLSDEWMPVQSMSPAISKPTLSSVFGIGSKAETSGQSLSAMFGLKGEPKSRVRLRDVFRDWLR